MYGKFSSLIQKIMATFYFYYNTISTYLWWNQKREFKNYPLRNITESPSYFPNLLSQSQLRLYYSEEATVYFKVTHLGSWQIEGALRKVQQIRMLKSVLYVKLFWISLAITGFIYFGIYSVESEIADNFSFLKFFLKYGIE